MGVKLDSPQNWTVRESRKRQITQGERSQNKNWIKSIEARDPRTNRCELARQWKKPGEGLWFVLYEEWIRTSFLSQNSYLWRFQFNPYWHFIDLKWRFDTQEGSWRLKWYELVKVIQGQIRI